MITSGKASTISATPATTTSTDRFTTMVPLPYGPSAGRRGQGRPVGAPCANAESAKKVIDRPIMITSIAVDGQLVHRR